MTPATSQQSQQANHALSLERFDLAGQGLAMEFHWQQDRSGHLIRLLSPDGAIVLVRSVEDTSRPWPISPPLQQVTCEHHDSRPVILAVGMAQRNHWSAAFQFAPDRLSLRAEVACRLNDPSTPLGSTYSLIPKSGARLSDDGKRLDLDRFGVSLVCAPPARLSLDLSRNEVKIIASSGQSDGLASPDWPGAGGQFKNMSRTWQWDYSFEIAET